MLDKQLQTNAQENHNKSQKHVGDGCVHNNVVGVYMGEHRGGDMNLRGRINVCSLRPEKGKMPNYSYQMFLRNLRSGL